MEKQEIKKAYQKMSRQLKRQGLNYTCVMNARQQAMHRRHKKRVQFFI